MLYDGEHICQRGSCHASSLCRAAFSRVLDIACDAGAETVTLSPAVTRYVKVPAGRILLKDVRVIDGTGIAPGKEADLVVVDGDPSKKIDDIEKTEIVFKDGVGYDSQRLLESVKGRYGQY